MPIICVGNLSVGGTGKSPMVEYLMRLLHNDFAVATLSRGYKRKTKGYALATQQTQRSTKRWICVEANATGPSQ